MLIKDQEKLFTYIDSDFENWNVDEGMQKTGKQLETIIQNKNFTYQDVFNTDTDCMTQEEVINFIEKSDKNIFNHAHFFLLKNTDGKFFVADVRVIADDLYVDVRRFERDYVWFAEYLPRVVVPQRESTALKPETLSPSETLPLQRTNTEIQHAIELLKKEGYQISKIM